MSTRAALRLRRIEADIAELKAAMTFHAQKLEELEKSLENKPRHRKSSRVQGTATNGPSVSKKADQ